MARVPPACIAAPESIASTRQQRSALLHEEAVRMGHSEMAERGALRSSTKCGHLREWKRSRRPSSGSIERSEALLEDASSICFPRDDVRGGKARPRRRRRVTALELGCRSISRMPRGLARCTRSAYGDAPQVVALFSTRSEVDPRDSTHGTHPPLVCGGVRQKAANDRAPEPCHRRCLPAHVDRSGRAPRGLAERSPDLAKIVSDGHTRSCGCPTMKLVRWKSPSCCLTHGADSSIRNRRERRRGSRPQTRAR